MQTYNYFLHHNTEFLFLRFYMKKQLMNKSMEKIETTIGELIEAVTKIAEEHTQNEQEKYWLVSQTVEEILANSQSK